MTTRILLAAALAALGAGALGACLPHDCNAENCADGCCDDHGVCHVGEAQTACGIGASACVDCSHDGKECVAGVCGHTDKTCTREGYMCSDSADCCSGLVCRGAGCWPACKREWESCSTDSDCCNHDLGGSQQMVCSASGSCVACKGTGESCDYSSECCSAARCTTDYSSSSYSSHSTCQ